MKYLARSASGRPLVGDRNGFVPLAAAHPELETVAEALPVAAGGALKGPSDASATPIEREDLRFGPPIATPRTVLGIGLNYAEHAMDLDEERPDEPASFMKPATAIVGPGGPIRLPPPERSERVTAEAELALVFGRTCRDVDESAADEVVAGYLPAIDMTAEDVLERNPRFLTRAKSFDTFLVLGPWIAVPDDPIDLDDREVRTVVNDETVAANAVRNMLFSPRELVSFHSRVQTFRPGDVLTTGTPGAKHVVDGDRVTAEVDGIGAVSADVTGPG